MITSCVFLDGNPCSRNLHSLLLFLACFATAASVGHSSDIVCTASGVQRASGSTGSIRFLGSLPNANCTVIVGAAGSGTTLFNVTQDSETQLVFVYGETAN